MKKAHELPQAVNNLRAIWDKKKVEMQFTQIEAAKKLGWSQGAISHYLNNITALGPAAVVKFANFLGVDPLEIDPEVIAHLPNTHTVRVRYSTANFSKTIDKTNYHSKIKSTVMCTIDPDTLLFLPGIKKGIRFCKPGDTCMVKMCNVDEAPNSSYFLVQLKGENRANFYRYDVLPPKAKTKKIKAVLFIPG
jgi:transcriptional regulator with XRE-family HTH domain